MQTTKKDRPGGDGSKGRKQPLPLVFFHIPKAGGSTLKEIIFRQYPRGTAAWISFQRPEMVQEFLSKTSAERARMQCLMGHIPYGFHNEFPKPAFLFTMLRDPVKRFLSEYRYMLSFDRDGAWRPPDDAMASLEAFLDYRIQNNAIEVQTSMISGYFPGVGVFPPFDPLPDDALDLAKANIRDNFGLVGVTDRFDETMLLLKKQLGWRRGVHYARRNTTSHESAARIVNSSLMERIRQHTSNDAALVAYANEFLDQAIAQQEPSFADELEALKRRNHCIYLMTEPLKGGARRVLGLPGMRRVGTIAEKIARRLF